MSLNQPFVSEAYDRLIAAQQKNLAQIIQPSTYAGIGIALSLDSALKTGITDIRAARERLDWSQGALAERLGMNQPALSQIENGKPIPAWLDLAMRALLALEGK